MTTMSPAVTALPSPPVAAIASQLRLKVPRSMSYLIGRTSLRTQSMYAWFLTAHTRARCGASAAAVLGVGLSAGSLLRAFAWICMPAAEAAEARMQTETRLSSTGHR